MEQAIAALYEAEEHDSVIMHLNCDGGSHNVGDSLLFAMQNCKADIHVIATGRIASYATFVLLSAHSFELSPFATILCHSASFGYAGKSQDTKEYVDFTYKQTEKMLRHYYEGFLTEGEITRIIKERYEHLMDADEFVERFNKLQKQRMRIERAGLEFGVELGAEKEGMNFARQFGDFAEPPVGKSRT